MSPKIGMALDARPYVARSLRPIDQVRMVANVVESQGMRVALDGEHGVGRHRITGGWIADGPYRPRRVSLLGAVCLVMQPPMSLTVEDGALEALDVSEGWLTGLWHGFHNEADVLLLGGPCRALYLDGVRAGHLLFAEMTIECEACGERRHRSDVVCRGCR